PQGAVSPTNTSPEYRAQAVAKPQSKPAPQQRGVVQTVRPTPRRGTFETVLATQVYDGPSENAALVASIQAGMKVNVVNSSRGWLEIRSRYGRPPGFIRQDTAVRVAQN
ncbi:MAG: SH3 domain-containing protein, partial [Candidatus Binatia bacterium]